MFKEFKQETPIDFPLAGVDDLDLINPPDSESKFQQKIEIVLSKAEACPPEMLSQLRSMIHEFRDIFPSSIVEMQRMKNYVYTPDLTTAPKIPHRRARRFTNPEIAAMEELIELGVPAGIVKPSTSSFVNSLVFVPKSDGSLRPCLNAKIINGSAKNRQFHLVPLINDCIEWLGTTKFKSFLDNLSGYWQVAINPECTQYFAFNTHRGVFEFLVLVMGVDDGVFFYQSIMEKVFHEFLHSSVRVYLDDIGVKSNTAEEHLLLLRSLFVICRNEGISLKLEKCLFFVVNHVWLGYVFKEQGIAANLANPNVQALANLPYPANIKDILHFCGLMEFFSRFLDHLADKLVPLRRLLRKGVPWNFTKECQEAVDLVKHCLMNSPVLKIPDRTHRFVASADASKYALGGVLEQYDENSILRPVGYWSKTLSPVQQEYPNYDRECLAQVGLWQHYRYLLLGPEFDAVGDCSAVVQLMNADDPHGRRARLFQAMSEFNAVLKHRPGTVMGGPDCLSRLIAIGVPEPVPVALDIASDSAFPIVLKYLTTGSVPGIKNDARFRRFANQFIVLEEKLFRKSKSGIPVLVLGSREELFEKLKVLHDQLGHFSFRYIFEWAALRWWRPHLGREIRDYCRGCDACQRFSLTRPKFAFDGQSAISGLFNNWYGDFVGPFPVSKSGSRYVCVFVEPLSGFPEFAATPDATGFSAAQVLEKEIICRYGVRGEVRVDQGPCFISGCFKDMCKQYGVKCEYAPAYVPELMAWVEHMNRVVRYALAKNCRDDYTNWDSHLAAIFRGIRCKVNARSGYSPYFLLFGISPTFPEVGDMVIADSNVDTRVLELEGLPGVRQGLERASRSTAAKKVFQIGDLVKVFSDKLRKKSVLGKSNYRWSQPMIVIACFDHDLYDLQSQDGLIRECIHVSRLDRYYFQTGAGAFSNCFINLSMGAVVQKKAKTSLVLSNPECMD
jgi:hypothetical protein